MPSADAKDAVLGAVRAEIDAANPGSNRGGPNDLRPEKQTSDQLFSLAASRNWSCVQYATVNFGTLAAGGPINNDGVWFRVSRRA